MPNSAIEKIALSNLMRNWKIRVAVEALYY